MPQGLHVVIADRDPQVRSLARSRLVQLGYDIVAEPTNGHELANAWERYAPELLIAEIALAPLVRAAAAVGAQACDAPLVLLLDRFDRPTLRRGYSCRPFGWLGKPLREHEIEPTVTIALQRHAEMASLKAELAAAGRRLEERKLVERAKALLMKRARIDEAEAYLRLRQAARNNRQQLAEVARGILLAEGLLGDGDDDFGA